MATNVEATVDALIDAYPWAADAISFDTKGRITMPAEVVEDMVKICQSVEE